MVRRKRTTSLITPSPSFIRHFASPGKTPRGAAGYSLTERNENTSMQNKVERPRRVSREYLTPRSTSRSFRAFPPLMKTFPAKASEVPPKGWEIDAKHQLRGQVAA